MKEIKLTGRQLEIMNILWESEKPLTITQMFERNSSISINTYRAMVKELLKRKYIEVDNIIINKNNIFSRSYKPTFTADEYMTYQLAHEINKTVSPECIVATLLDTRSYDEETIDRLENIIQQYREKLKKDNKI